MLFSVGQKTGKKKTSQKTSQPKNGYAWSDVMNAPDRTPLPLQTGVLLELPCHRRHKVGRRCGFCPVVLRPVACLASIHPLPAQRLQKPNPLVSPRAVAPAVAALPHVDPAEHAVPWNPPLVPKLEEPLPCLPAGLGVQAEPVNRPLPPSLGVVVVDDPPLLRVCRSECLLLCCCRPCHLPHSLVHRHRCRHVCCCVGCCVGCCVSGEVGNRCSA